MSWIENIKSDLIITTGDSKVYTPLWINATKNVEYNIAEFNFPNLDGTLVNRGRPMGRRYALEIYFQGDDNIEQALAFETSANDPRAWTLNHPFYGTMIVHPSELTFDNTKYNVSKITGMLLETITEDAPITATNALQEIQIIKENTDSNFAFYFANQANIKAENISTLQNNNALAYSKGKKITRSGELANAYFTAFNDANSAVLTATAKPLLAIRSIQTFFNAPAQFEASVKNRVGLFLDQYDILRLQIGDTKTDKIIYENTGATLISGAVSSSSIHAEYDKRSDVLFIIDLLILRYNQYLVDLDSIQSTSITDSESYVPDFDAQNTLNELVNYAIANLFNIALGAKQERIIYVENDSNVVLLAHRFYGLDVFDSTIDTIIKNNNIGLSEILKIKKGRKITYYV